MLLTTTDPATINTINTLMLIGFSILSATLTGVLKQVHWPSWGNDLVVFVVAILCMLLYVWVDSLLTGSASLIFGSIAGVSVVVMSRFDPLQKWTNYLQAAVLVMHPDGVKLFVRQGDAVLPARLTPTAPLPIIPMKGTFPHPLPAGPDMPPLTRGNTPAPISFSGGQERPPARQFIPIKGTLPPITLPLQTPPGGSDGHKPPPASGKL